MLKSPFGIFENATFQNTQNSELKNNIPNQTTTTIEEKPLPSSKRPKSASSINQKKTKSHKSPPIGLSIDDWNLLLQQAENESFRFPFLKKGSKTRTYEQTTAPNFSTYHLSENDSKEKQLTQQFQTKLQKENESNFHYLKKCIDEINELCYELKYYYYYEYYNEKFMKKFISLKSFQLPSDGKNPFLHLQNHHHHPHHHQNQSNHEQAFLEEKEIQLINNVDVSIKFISIGKFHREHEEILTKYFAFRKSQVNHSSESFNPSAAPVIHTNIMGQSSIVTGNMDNEGSESLLRSNNQDIMLEDSDQMPTGLPPRPMTAGKSGGRAHQSPSPRRNQNFDGDDDFEFDSEFQTDRRLAHHNTLNELQKRAMIQSIQQQILIDLHEKDQLLLQQIEEIKRRGWNKSLINS